MGATESTKYSISNFTDEVTIQLQSSDKPDLEKLKHSLFLLKLLFTYDSSVFENAKLMEKEAIKCEAEEISGTNTNKPLPEKKTINFVRCLSQVPKLLSHLDTKEKYFLDCLNIFLDMFAFLGNEKAFLEFFFINGLESISNIIINKTKTLPFDVINKTVKVLKDILELKLKNSKYFNLNSLLKLLHINALLLNKFYTENNSNLITIASYLKTYFKLLLALKEGVFSKKVKLKESVQLCRTVLVSN